MQRTLWPVVNRLLAEIPDRDLLGRYVLHGDQDAFAHLVTRYHRLVWGQCRNLLANDADADDAFQATFLTLARSAKALRAGMPLGPWLHGVAFRVCMNARRAAGRRAKRERASARPEAQKPVADSSWETAFAAAAEEVQKLPEAQRVAFVLCYLEGRPVAAAAAGLGLKLGTFTARLSRAKQTLVDRLARRGLGAEILALGGVTGGAAAAPAGLVGRTLALPPSGAPVPGPVLALTSGVTGMTTTPIKSFAAAVAAVAVAVLAGGGGGWPGSAAGTPPRVAKASPPEESLITPAARTAIDAGLEYLATHQAKDGSWVTGDYRGNVAVTSLAGRAFLAAGYQPGRGSNGARLAGAIEYVLRSEGGGLLARGSAAPMYEHGFAVQFLAGAYGRVVDKGLKGRMSMTLTRAVRAIADGQNPEGGWRYRPKSRDADVSVTCCQLHALAAAKRAGFEVPRGAIEKGIGYVLACRDSNQGGRFRYLPGAPGGDAAADEYTAAAVSALTAVAFRGDEGVMEKGTELIRGFKSPGASDAFFYTSRAHAIPVMKAAGGKDWGTWYAAVRDDLLARRNKDGVWDDSKTASLFNTALALIILQSAGEPGAGAGAKPLAHWQGKWVLSTTLNAALGFTDAGGREGGLLDAPPLSFRISLADAVGDGMGAGKVQGFRDLVFDRMKHRIVATGKWEVTFRVNPGITESDCFVTEHGGATYLWVPADYVVVFGGRVSFLEGADPGHDALALDFNTTENHLAGGGRSPDTFAYQRDSK